MREIETLESVGGYVLLERLNQGGMADIYVARRRDTDELYALKRMRSDIALESEAEQLFQREIALSHDLSHPNIAQVLASGNDYLVMEYISGKDLRCILQEFAQRGLRLPVAISVHIARQVLQALHYAHTFHPSTDPKALLRVDSEVQNQRAHHGWLHRDVSPHNVLIGYDGSVKLIDFGIAKPMQHANHPAQSKILKGKYGYMSPEQVLGLPLDARSDVYSLGVILYEMLTGTRLFQGHSDFSVLEKVRYSEVLPPHWIASEIPAALETVLLRALAQHRDHRFKSALDMDRALASFDHIADDQVSLSMRQDFEATFNDEQRKIVSWLNHPLGFDPSIIPKELKLEPRARSAKANNDTPTAEPLFAKTERMPLAHFWSQDTVLEAQQHHFSQSRLFQPTKGWLENRWLWRAPWLLAGFLFLCSWLPSSVHIHNEAPQTQFYVFKLNSNGSERLVRTLNLQGGHRLWVSPGVYRFHWEGNGAQTREHIVALPTRPSLAPIPVVTIQKTVP